jgi:penicillin-binding protein 1C
MKWLLWSIVNADWGLAAPRRWSWRHWVALACFCVSSSLIVTTWMGLATDDALVLERHSASARILLDRNGHPLAEDIGEWNVQNQIPLYRVPVRLTQAVLIAEDRRFFRHGGVDWLARAHALWQGLLAGRSVRGASTITEQVVRMLVPRPRTLWSKWLEGFDARGLEASASKSDILEFYLNQVPYAANRRGVVQAAHYYFGRDLETLDDREMLTLAVLPRAPSGLDPYRGGAKTLDRRSVRLANDMRHAGLLSGDDWQRLIETPLELAPQRRSTAIGHFRSYVLRQVSDAPARSHQQRIVTTLDGGLMEFAQGLLDQRLAALAARRVHNGAVLVVDHRSGEILAWVVAGADTSAETPGRFVDAILVPRQPGSALKPFLYAAAFDAGWSPGVRIADTPLSEAIGSGMHRFNNYSRQFYGDVTVRQALGNSLNIPAVHAVNFIGPDRYLSLLHELGFESLNKPAGFYGDGLALGNGEVSLLELVRGFTALANGGRYSPLLATISTPREKIEGTQVLTRGAATMVGDILSDPWARVMEFGRYSTLNLPVQTAVKTGTSTDYRDSWAVGFDSRYVVGIWMGNLDRSPTDGVTGSTGPGLALRGLFAYLNRDQNSSRLPISGDLELENNCAFGDGACEQMYDYRRNIQFEQPVTAALGPFIRSPTPNLRLAYDPRLPAERQVFRFEVGGVNSGEDVEWFIDGHKIAQTPDGKLMWSVRRGTYALEVVVNAPNGAQRLGPVAFSVR